MKLLVKARRRKSVEGQLAMFDPGGAPTPEAKQKLTVKRESVGAWQSIPGGRKGGKRRRKGNRWEYRYLKVVVKPKKATGPSFGEDIRELRDKAAGVLGARLGQLEREGWRVEHARAGIKPSDTEMLGPLNGSKVRQMLDTGIELRRASEPGEKEIAQLDDSYKGDLLKPDMAIEQAESVILKAPIEHLALYYDGKMQHRIKGQRTYVDIPPDVIRDAQRRGNVVLTHNHPRGTTLSGDDLVLAIAGNMQEIRAVNPDGTVWVLRRPGRAWGDEFGAVPGLPRSLREAIHILEQGATRVASQRMDRYLIEAGTKPGDTAHPVFSQEKFDEFVSEAKLQLFNRFLAPSGAQIEKVSTRGGSVAKARHQAGCEHTPTELRQEVASRWLDSLLAGPRLIVRAGS